MGDDEPVPMAERPAVLRIRACTGPAEAVRLWAEMVADVQARAAPMGRVLAAAADADGAAAATLARSDAERHTGALDFANRLAAIGGLRDDVAPEQGADVCWALNDAALYRRLVLERGRRLEAFADWLGQAVRASLLPA